VNWQKHGVPEREPSTLELRAAVKDCFYAATQCATYHYWFLYARPLLEANDELKSSKMPLLMQNGIAEAVLLFFRKTHEFFKAQSPGDKPDTLYAYRWTGFAHCGDVYSATTVAELHKRVGHITVREARDGKFEWLLFQMAMAAFERWITFFGFLADSYYASDPEMKDSCTKDKRGLEGLKQRMEREKVAFETPTPA